MKFLKRSFVVSLLLLSCLWVWQVAAADYMAPALWRGTSNAGQLPPEIKQVDSPYGPAVQAVAVEDGQWQGMKITFAEPVDLRNVGKITFDFEQNAYNMLIHEYEVQIL